MDQETGTTASSPERNFSSDASELPSPSALVKPEEIQRGPNILPPTSLKPYTTKQLRKRHVEPWLVFSILGVTATIVITRLQMSSSASPQDSCIDSGSSRLEQLFRINAVGVKGLTFAQAKFLDLLWDTAIGQGGKFIHGLILYHLVSRSITLLLEHSTLSYGPFFGLKFSPVSIESLWALFSILSQAPAQIKFMCAGLIFVIGYVLSFATIWSATTGYEADTVPAYDIMNTGAFVKQDSNRLTTCWSVPDTNRSDFTLSQPIIGPTFAQAFGTWENIGLGAEFERLHMRAASPKVNTSEEFQNLYTYAISKNTFLHHYNDTVDATALKGIGKFRGTDNWYDDDCDDGGGHETSTGYRFNQTCQRAPLYMSVLGWQYAGFEQKDREDLPPDTRHNQPPWLDGSEYVPYHASFNLNVSIAEQDDMIPYNSTLWWNKSRIALNAPFLNLGTDCQWSNGSLGLCLCFDGKVVSQDFRESTPTCLNDTGYRWGFSGFVVVIALALETVWLLICMAIWLVNVTMSELVRMHRPGTGVIRGVLDIAGAIDLSIGSDTGAYTEEELKKELEKCPSIGYEIDHGTENPRIRLRPVGHGVRTRQNLRINRHTAYG
ncbi:hypothetical protein F4777DRAFT_601631 [Nemania sp. FL0916]|nr:hypothetical protein F4777DRAFT_601631 [Nemania sp. FL0916]